MPRKNTHKEQFIQQVLDDYSIACQSREASIIGRREVLTGKAKFGIFGDGKEVPQLAMARAFKNGDWRSGYYRDQTFMLATGMMTLESFFSQLYGDTDLNANPANGGRMMNNHFATRSLDHRGEWKDLAKQKNSSPDISPTAGQMPRLLGLAMASKVYRELKDDLKHLAHMSNKGNEVAFGTIGDASTSEGHFFETINAAAVLKVPLAMSVWDDGYGISVPIEHQTAKSSISEALKGFEKGRSDHTGIRIFKEKAWDYPALIDVYQKGIETCRKEHIPVLFHITECTQPQGHSTSGSHERYKDEARLKWEKDFDCNQKMRQWIIDQGIATEAELDELEKKAKARAREARKNAWQKYQQPILDKRKEFNEAVDLKGCYCVKTDKIDSFMKDLNRIDNPIRKDVISTGKKILRLICHDCSSEQPLKQNVTKWLDKELKESYKRYNSHLYSQSQWSPHNVREVKPQYAKDAKMVNGREILVNNFDRIFEKYPESMIFGEDVGHIGGVNQTLEGLQKKYGKTRISDTGIREATIIGQGLGMALRGLRPIAEIQYFDYLLYGLQVISDDLATLRYRTVGGQKAPLIISTRGHRLEGIWHSGSPLSMVINSIRGVHVLVPRDMTRAAGFYNTLMQSDDPALIIEPLNAYRLKEKLPSNIGEFTIPIGKAEILNHGTDITLVTYGSCVRIAQDAIAQLNEFDISVELIDVQSLLPFDLDNTIVKSLQKTNKIVFFDEDVPGGATAFMMQKVLEEQKGYRYLDAEPATVTAREHRAAYSSDGDYFSNPNAEDVFDQIYDIMHEFNPSRYTALY